MRSCLVVAMIVAGPAYGQTWDRTDCSIVETFAREAVSEGRNPSASYVRSLEAALNEAIARLSGEDLEVVLDMSEETQGQREGWPNQTTELMATLLQDRCGIVLR